MPTIIDNPFTALSLIGAPAILTNASSLLALSTSNRFAQAIDRARVLSGILQKEIPDKDEWKRLHISQLTRVERRCVLLMNALTFIYLAIGSFGSASLVSLLGAVFGATQHHHLFQATAILALIVGVVGVGSLVVSCILLVSETRIAVANLTEEGALVRRKYDEYLLNSAA